MEDFDQFTDEEIATVEAYLIREAQENTDFFESLVVGYVENMSGEEIEKILRTLKIK